MCSSLRASSKQTYAENGKSPSLKILGRNVSVDGGILQNCHKVHSLLAEGKNAFAEWFNVSLSGEKDMDDMLQLLMILINFSNELIGLTPQQYEWINYHLEKVSSLEIYDTAYQSQKTM